MTIKGLIKTEAEYETALSEIDRLMDAPDNSPEAEQMELLSILVDAY
jgi:HTH-type transcriptional regulator / antitoxin HigA